MSLLSINADAKTKKGTKLNVLTGILYLAPSDESGEINTCPNATKGCREACLFTAGRGAFSNVKDARIKKTLWFVKDQDGFLRQLMVDILALAKKAGRKGMDAAVRLNGTSDLAWELFQVDGKNLMQHFPHVQFYDYTKRADRMDDFLQGRLPSNYHLTFSQAETRTNKLDVDGFWTTGANIAVVFNKVPATYRGRPVIDGDESDVRFKDGVGVVVGLKAKGKARKDTSGFVVTV